MNTLLILILTIAIVFSVYMFLAWKQLKKIQQKIDQRETQINNQQVTISYQREQLENAVYEANDNLLATYVRFEDVNHLFITRDVKELTPSENVVDMSFFDDLGVDPSIMKVEHKFITCLMPFNKQYDKLYESIQQSCQHNGCSCHRSDEEYVPGSILKYTMELILKSDVIIAVLDGRNANVFYEVGIAHSIGKTVILLSNAKKFKNTPFDVKGSRFILYQNLSDLQEQLTTIFNKIYDVD